MPIVRRTPAKLLFLMTTFLLAATPLRSAAAPTVIPPARRDAVEAAYPPDGKGDAKVVLVLVIDAAGAVTSVTVREGDAPFADAAAASAKTWTFTPATRDGTPIAARVLAVVTFHAPAEAPAPIPAGSPVSARGPADGLANPRDTKPGQTPLPLPPHDEVVEVAVNGEHEELGTIHVPRAETRFIPGAFGDPFRVVEALPGVSPWISGLPYFYVRGMSPENVGYTVDGIPVPLLFHVGSGPSTVAASLVDSVDLFPAAYPARYGRYAGAMIAGETAPPDEAHPHGDFQVRLFDAAAFAEAPLRDGRDTVTAAGRYGYTGLVLALIDPNDSLSYWDYQARVTHRFRSHDQASLFVFGSYDRLANRGVPFFRVQYHRADLRFDHPLREGNLRLAATLSYDDTMTAETTDATVGRAVGRKGPGARLRVEFDQHVVREAWVRAGADVVVRRFDADAATAATFAPHTDFVGGGYADVVWRPTRAIELVPGYRLDAYQVRGQTTAAPQPRVSAKVKLGGGVAWVSAFGLAHQEPTDAVLVPAKLPDPIDEGAQESYQASEALEAPLPLEMRIRATGFVTLLEGAHGAGEERSGGVELFLHRDFTERLGGFASYTISRTVDAEGGQTLRALGDSTHVVSVSLGYDLGLGWRLGGRFFYRSSRPYHQTCETPDCAPGVTSNRYIVSGTLPDFARVDVRVEKRWTFANGRWLAGALEVFNALDAAETTGVNYSLQEGLTRNTQNAILLPSIGVEGGF